MKTFVHVLLIAACFVAYARAFPSSKLGYDSESDEDFDTMSFDFSMPNFFSETFNRLRQNLFNYFWNFNHDFTNIKIPDGANTTSTTMIVNGHVVTINETTYTDGDGVSGTAFRFRTIDVKPLQNETESIDGGNASTVRPEAEPESRETVEDFNNEISKNTETLTA